VNWYPLQPSALCLEYGTGAGTVLGAPRAPPGERGIYWLVRISTAVRLPATSIRQGKQDLCGRGSIVVVSRVLAIGGRKEGRTGLYGDSAYDRQ
jgi:hypothetical protein